MSDTDTVQGLSCPRCGGMVPVPEGQSIVRCPYCDLRSFVRGERGILRYQVPQRVPRQDADNLLQKFLRSSMAIAPAAARQAQLSEAFLVHLPFWTLWGRIGGWVFGEKRVGSGNDKRYEPREARVVQEMTWNAAACDVGEFGVTSVPPVDQNLEPFNADGLHASGMVFEPVSSSGQARAAAEKQFLDSVQRSAGLDRVSQVFARILRGRFGLVYHPLWVLRYHFRKRIFQVVVDAHTGKVLYGKAPGNTLYRAAVLVGGMMIGAFIAVDIPIGVVYFTEGDDGGLMFALGALVVGAGMMFAAYRAFRRGEQYEYRQAGGSGFDLSAGMEALTSVKDVEKWIERLT